MKISSHKLFLFCMLALLSAAGCKKGYLSGGSLHNPVTPLNNMDYLKANSYKLFDTVTQIIEKFNLAGEVNNAKTFFAFTDYSVVRMLSLKIAEKQQVNPLAAYTLDSLYKDITADSIRQYMINEPIELASAPELKAAPYLSQGKTTMAALKQLQTGSPYTDRTKAPTYLLYFVKVRGALDEPGITPPTNEIDISVLCQTTGIKTSNGTTILHVLNNAHTFVRF